MNVLVVGRGGREHSIIMKLAESKQITNLYAAPGNGGIREQAKCVAIDEMDIEGLVSFAKESLIDMTVVGPENPLNEGIANRFLEEGFPVFAPTKEAALLEGSKSFAKEFMKKYEIPTADYAVFTNPNKAKEYIKEKGAPIVIKADGLASGKGVIVALTLEEAFQAVDDMLVSKAFASAGATVVVEEFLAGKEFSLMAFVHENQVFPMVTARDHKRAYDQDEGPNTGGMGAYAPVSDVTEEQLDFSIAHILQKTADGMIEEGRPFTGILYAGLIMTAAGPKVIEFNTRFGDPETQVVLPLLENDLLQVFTDVLNGEDPQLKWRTEACAGVVLASKGYPGSYDKGHPIPVIEQSDNQLIIHAGTKLNGKSLISDGGRVLLVGAKAESLAEATEKIYQTLETANLAERFFYRQDIGRL